MNIHAYAQSASHHAFQSAFQFVTLQQHATCLATRAFARSPGGPTLLAKEHACQCEAINTSKNWYKKFPLYMHSARHNPYPTFASHASATSQLLHARTSSASLPVHLHACQTRMSNFMSRTSCKAMSTAAASNDIRFGAFSTACKHHCHRDICVHNANLLMTANTHAKRMITSQHCRQTCLKRKRRFYLQQKLLKGGEPPVRNALPCRLQQLRTKF